MPEAVRIALNLTPGLEVDVIAKGGVAYIVPIRPMSKLATALEGKLKPSDVKTVRDKSDRKL